MVVQEMIQYGGMAKTMSCMVVKVMII